MIVSAVGAPVATLAQSVGSISGTVTDGAKAALGNARVSIAGPKTVTVSTNADGTFTASVPPGIYSVTVSANGFETAQEANVTVAPGAGAALTVVLLNASLTTIGRVSRSVAALNTTSAATSDVTAQTFIDQGEKNVKNVLDQVPGIEILRDTGGNNEPGSNSSISIRGAQPYESQVLIDGHPVLTAGNGASGFNTTFINSLLLNDVEVAKGPGNFPLTIENAVGGTVNFKTPPITPNLTYGALVGYDSYNGNYYSFKASDTFGKVGFFVGAARYQTPGYLTPQNLFGGNNANDPLGISVQPSPSTVYGPGAGYIGVLDFSYPATSDFESDSQVAKIAFNFSPVTSLQFSAYATQTSLDETGNNVGNITARIVPCIYSNGTVANTNCPQPAPGDYFSNYTSNQFTNLIGTVQKINYYAAYPNTTEFDNEPIFTGEFRTVLGPGSFLARYYTGSITRNIYQAPAPYAIAPCFSPQCPFVINPPSGIDNGYPGEPYTEPTTDILHGLDAQYSIPFGPNSITLGYDRHVDQANFYELYSINDPTNPASFYQLSFGGSGSNLFQSIAYSLRGSFQLAPALQLEVGGYESSTSYVGTRFDPRAGLTYKFGPSATIRFSAGSAFVAPYQDLIITRPRTSGGTITLPTTSFRPETSFGYDLGSDVKVDSDTLLSTDLYLTNIFNRYAQVTTSGSYTYRGRTYGLITQNGNQANVRQQGLEFSILHQPKIGFGARAALDVLKDYAFNQDPNANVNSVFSATPADNVQLPDFPYYKLRADLFYNFASTGQIRVSSQTYGANNSYGQPGFTTFDAQVRVPLHYGITAEIGGSNIFNKDNYQTGGVFHGGYTFAALGGGSSYTDLTYVQPRTLFLQLSAASGSK